MKTNVNVHSTVELADHRRVESLDNGGWLDNAARVSATCTLGSAQEEQVLNKANDCQHRKHKAQSTSLATQGWICTDVDSLSEFPVVQRLIHLHLYTWCSHTPNPQAALSTEQRRGLREDLVVADSLNASVSGTIRMCKTVHPTSTSFHLLFKVFVAK